jgi:hypothetical protein
MDKLLQDIPYNKVHDIESMNTIKCTHDFDGNGNWYHNNINGTQLAHVPILQWGPIITNIWKL